MRYLIKNGKVIDPANKLNDMRDMLIADGRIEKIDKNIDAKVDEVIEARGLIVMPGLVDMHTHLREPGREDEETVASGTRAAIRGAYTSIACMPNTEPALDNAKMLAQLKDIIKKDAVSNVHIIGAITEGRAGKKLTDFKALKKEGAIALSDDGFSVEDTALCLDALKDARANSLLLIEHCEDTKLSAGGVMNESYISTKMGLRGIPARAEYERVKRNIELAKKANTHVHIAHVSCKESVEIIRQAKKESIKVSAETCPHYFSLTEDCCMTYDTNTKMNPPLRSKSDVEAIKKGLSDGTIDAIATDHAPHTDSEKDVEFDYAPFGVIGLETALSVAVTELIETGALSWEDLIVRMSAAPAKLLGIERGSLKKGAAADIAVIDPEKEYIYKKESIESRSKNSPFINWKLKAKAVHVFVGGMLVMKDASIVV